MKNLNEKSMIEVMRTLNYLIESERTDDSTKATCQDMFDRLTNILRSEMNDCKIGKFNLQEFCSKDNSRPTMASIYHSEGFKVATNARILCIVKDNYPEYLEGKMLKADGSFAEGNFPRYKSVIPNIENDYKEYAVDFNVIEQAEKEAKVQKKMPDPKGVFVKVGKSLILMDNVEKMAKFMQTFGISSIWCNEQNPERPLLTKDGENQCVIMPHELINEESEKNIVFDANVK